MVGQGGGQGRFHFHSPRQVANLAVLGQVELLNESNFEFAIPFRVERTQVTEEAPDSHPFGQFLIFGNIADFGNGAACKPS